jgi:hypothetical protein
MAVITRCDLENKTKREALVDKALHDMGLGDEPEREHGPELRAAAKRYYLGMIKDDLGLSNDVLFNECFHSEEGMTLGFVEGYEACLRNHGGK